MTAARDLADPTAEELFEGAPCGYVTTRMDGTIARVNRTFEELTGFDRGDLVGRRRLQDLLTGGGRIYHETHFAPLLQMQGSVREIALDFVRADGTRLPALVNAVVQSDAEGRNAVVRTTVFDASERRRYEAELVAARERERATALELQRSLLSGELPRADGLRVDVAYVPAVRGLEVGGDWWDAFWLEEPHTLGLVVGDVVGRGIAAAAAMGQLRSAIRALAAAGRGPAPLLDDLDQYARRHDVGQMATIVCATLDLRTGDLRYACAGHPPPLLLRGGDGEASLLGDGRSLPLDAFGSRPARSEGRARLEPGGAFVLYTDGLIERRHETLGVRLDELLGALTRRVAAADLADALVRELRTGDEPDDVCVLAVRLTR